MKRQFTRIGTAITIAATLLLSACSSDTNSATTENSTDISIVASTAIWGDIAQNIADTAHVPVTVTSIIEGENVDPHHFEPTATDIATAKEADIVVVGGGGYDAWLYTAVTEDTVIHALDLNTDDHDHEHDHSAETTATTSEDETGDQPVNEHIWYDIDAVSDVAQEIAEKINTINADAKADASGYVEKLEAAHQRTHDLPALTVAQTEPIADYLLAHSPMTEITPDGYRAATLAEQEPTAADLAAFLDLIETGELQVLIYNPQTETDMTTRIREAAETTNIPVVEIYETPPANQSYLDFITEAIDRLEAVK